MIHRIKTYLSMVGIRGLICAIKGKATKSLVLLKMNRPDIKYPFCLRLPSSDIKVFKQVFVDHEYNFDVRRNPKVIVDAGANIGLASIYFSNRFPESKIIAIEPEESNFEILKMNAEPYSNIISVRGALWDENKEINLVDPGFGKWGFMTQEEDIIERSLGEICHIVQGMTVDTIMKDQGIENIDILKLDIEGAEREVFSDSSSWIGKVDSLIIELHERMKSGCNRSFYNGTNGFDDEWLQGGSVCLTRSKGCLIHT
jgi:FkbM family methyltransferase